jgi:hypothetical protein
MILPKVDSRSKLFSFHENVGQTTYFTDEFNTDRPIPDLIQPIGNVQCTCYSVNDVEEDKEGISCDIDDLFNRVPHDNNGTDPKLVFKEAITNGLLPKNATTGRIKPFTSYFTAHTGDQDYFDNVRSSLTLANYPIITWGKWYDDWAFSTILQTGTSFHSYHCVTIEGWTQKYGEPQLIIEAWQGRKMYMKRSVFNTWASTWGFGTAVLSTKEIDKVRVKTVLEMIVDTLKNVAIYYQSLTKKK